MALMTVTEAAEKARVSESLVYDWCVSRRLPHYRLGGKGRRGKVMIEEKDLTKFIETLRVDSGRSRP